MTNGEERRALIEKAAEIRKATKETESRFAALPKNEQTAQVRETMEKLVAEMRRLDDNLQAMIRISEETQND